VFLFLAAALIAGRLATRLRMQVLALRAANAHATRCRRSDAGLATAADAGEVVAKRRCGAREDVDADAMRAEPATSARTARPANLQVRLEGVALAAADWAAQASPTGRALHRHPAGRTLVVPAARRRQGHHARPSAALPRWQRAPLRQRATRWWRRWQDDIAQAMLARVRLAMPWNRARAPAKPSGCAAALLSSVSHDLRSPLSAIVGAAESLTPTAATWARIDRQQPARHRAILSEGQRLDRYIQNLLDMTRLGHGALTLNRDWIARRRADRQRARPPAQAISPHQRFDIAAWPRDWRCCGCIPALVEQAMFNILENAAKFSPPGAAVDARRIAGRRRAAHRRRRSWPGHPGGRAQAHLRHVLQRRARRSRQAKGTGLGLAICQGMIGAHGGSVEALPGADGRRHHHPHYAAAGSLRLRQRA
jgi:two-component system sensor histidine kinase KdpD